MSASAEHALDGWLDGTGGTIERFRPAAREP
jgi:hypothetical protein